MVAMTACNRLAPVAAVGYGRPARRHGASGQTSVSREPSGRGGGERPVLSRAGLLHRLSALVKRRERPSNQSAPVQNSSRSFAGEVQGLPVETPQRVVGRSPKQTPTSGVTVAGPTWKKEDGARRLGPCSPNRRQPT